MIIPATALINGAQGTAHHLGGHAQWLLALPTTHIAGIQVLARSLVAGTRPVSVDRTAGFTPTAFLQGVSRLNHTFTATSLVPTQLDTLLLDPDHVRRSESIAALRSFNAILLGGAAPTSHLSATITELKLPVTRTYGMSETAGGCVYDGTALPGVTIKLTPDQRIMLTGPTLASGYLDNPAATAAAFPTINNTRWHLTNDLGTLTGGRLTITGRIDDIINTGGVKVAPAPIDDALLTVPGVTGACTVATPHPHWGQAVTAVITVCADSEIPTLTAIRTELSRSLNAAQLPQRLLITTDFPLGPSGKINRRAVAAWATNTVREQGL